MKKISNVIYWLAMCLLLSVFLFSGYMMFSEIQQYQKDQEEYEQLEQFVDMVEVPQDSSQIQKTELTIPSVDFDRLLEINSDCVGWIYLPDTQINYPVVQTDNNDYYLKRLFDRTYGNAGTIFLDAANDSDMSDWHSILYGHHMKNGTMFADIEKFEKQSYADSHSKGYYVTFDKIYEISFFSGYVTSPDNDSWIKEFTKEEFELWLGNTLSRSVFRSDVIPSASEQVITLSTCSYDFNDARFVLAGILKEMDTNSSPIKQHSKNREAE